VHGNDVAWTAIPDRKTTLLLCIDLPVASNVEMSQPLRRASAGDRDATGVSANTAEAEPPKPHCEGGRPSIASRNPRKTTHCAPEQLQFLLFL